MTAFKIAIIGAGSVGFTKKLVSDILKVPEFAGIEIALTDINAHNLDMIAQIIRRIVEVNGLPAKVTATTDRREALTGARYVMNCVRIGGLEAFADDIRIPLKYGVDQCVGDTICAGGIMYGQRGIAGDARLLPRHPRGRRARRAAPQLRQPDGDDDLGGARVRRRQHRRPLPRRAERPPPDRPRARRADRARSTSSAPASTTRPGTSTSASTAARSASTSCSPPSSGTRSSRGRRRSGSTC